MKLQSIRFRMTFWFTVVLIFISAVIVLSLYTAVRLNLRSTVRGYLVGMVEENVDKITFESDGRPGAGTSAIPLKNGTLLIDEAFMDIVNNVRAALYTEDGTLLYGENPLVRKEAPEAFSESKIWRKKTSEGWYLVYDRKLPLSNEVTLWIRGTVSEEEINGRLAEMIRLSLLFLPIVLAAALMLGYFLTTRMLSPIRQLEETAERISSGGDLALRLPVSKANDEMASLAKVFNRMLERLDRSFRTEQQFTSDASHELRTPLAVILAQCDAVLDRQREAEEYENALRVIRRQGRRMNTLVSEMLDFTRIEQGEGRYPMEEISLSGIAEEASEAARLLAERGMTLSAHIDANVNVHGNRTLLSRLLTNLLDNARRYGKEDGHITVEVRADQKNHRAVLSVRDDGPGIREEDKERIFERFYRGDSSRTSPGCGLGLSMVKAIADLHRAEITVESRIGEGSTFTVIFPV